MAFQVTISITRYAETDELVSQALAHALAQQSVEGEVLFIDQNVSSLLGASNFPEASLSLRVVRGRLASLSSARNLALDLAQTDVVIFLDADALAQPSFAVAIAESLTDSKTAVAGGKVLPKWSGNPPLLAKTRAVYDQFSLLDLGEETRLYHRVVGAGFGVDMSKLPAGFRFDEKLGRRDGMLFGGEESDFCKRAERLGLSIRYVGKATVLHCIEPERMRLSWQLRRLLYAGYGRAKLGGMPQPGGKRRFIDFALAPIYLPPYLAGWLWGRLTG